MHEILFLKFNPASKSLRVSLAGRCPAVLIPFPSSPRGKECSSPDRICGSPQLIDIISHERLRARIDRKKENCQLLHLARWLPPSPKLSSRSSPWGGPRSMTHGAFNTAHQMAPVHWDLSSPSAALLRSFQGMTSPPQAPSSLAVDPSPWGGPLSLTHGT